MNNSQLRTVMIYYLDHMDGPGDPPTVDTVHDSILKEDDGPPSSKNVYRGNVSWSLNASGNGKPKWPSAWMGMTVAALADALIPEPSNKMVAAKRAPAWFKALHAAGEDE